MFSSLGSIEEYRACPDGGTDCEAARADWLDMELKETWFTPKITLPAGNLSRWASMGGLVQYGCIIVGTADTRTRPRDAVTS